MSAHHTKVIHKNLCLSAFHLAEHIDVKKFREDFTGQILSEGGGELFYSLEDTRFLYILSYGVAVFCDFPDVEMTKTLNLILGYSTNPVPEKFRDDHEILISADKPIDFKFDALIVPRTNPMVIRIAMLNLAQSVALDYFLTEAQNLLAEIKKITFNIEMNGKMGISKKGMMRFIGKALNIKNRIAENLYIFDSPPMVWDDEYLDRINTGLARFFELRSRFKELEYTFRIIDDNLGAIRALYLHRESSMLEWIIILLILIEVVNMFMSKLH